MKRLTIAIVNYNSTDYLERCLSALQAHDPPQDRYHVVVVDNASEDRSIEALTSRFPSVDVLLNDRNVGFSTGCNQAIRHRPAQSYLLLNPDCEASPEAVLSCLEFLEGNLEAGIVGCRVENPDGTLQLACRRSIPRPSIALYRFLGLSRLFPKSPRFAGYNLTYLDANRTHPVEAVSGSFLMFRHAVLESSGFMDEDYFLYGEDLDFCYRAAQKGWKIYYFAGAQVVHHKRRSASRNPTVSEYHYYRSMEIFYQKHFASGRPLTKAWILGGIRLLHLASRMRSRLFGSRGAGSRY